MNVVIKTPSFMSFCMHIYARYYLIISILLSSFLILRIWSMFVLCTLIILYLSKRNIFSVEFFNNLAKHFLDFVLKKKILFICRERKREGKREGQKYWCVRETSWVASCTPAAGDLACSPGICLGIEMVTFWFTGRHPVHWASSVRATFCIFNPADMIKTWMKFVSWLRFIIYVFE